MRKAALFLGLLSIFLSSCGSSAPSEVTYHLIRQRMLRNPFLIYDVVLRKDYSATVTIQTENEATPKVFETTYTIKEIETMVPGKTRQTIEFSRDVTLTYGNPYEGTWGYSTDHSMSFQSVGPAYDTTRWVCYDESGNSYETSESSEGCSPYCFGYESLTLRAENV